MSPRYFTLDNKENCMEKEMSRLYNNLQIVKKIYKLRMYKIYACRIDQTSQT